MLLWSYFSVVFTDPGSVPPNWKPASDEERGDTDPLTASEFGSLPADTAQSRIRFCKKCNQLKPPRCHHCSVCEFLVMQAFSMFFSSFPINSRTIFIWCFAYFRWTVRVKNGPSLCLGCELCWSFELQVFSSLPGMVSSL